LIEVILFIVLGFVLIKFFWKTEEAQKPVFHVEEKHPTGFHALSAFLIMLMALITGGALIGVGDTATYAAVRAGGGDEAVTMVAGFVVMGMAGALMLINGFMPKLGLFIFLGGVVLSVLSAEMLMIGA